MGRVLGEAGTVGLKLGLGLGLAIMLAGCVTVIRGGGTVEGSAKRDLLHYAASRGPVLLELKGDPADFGDVSSRAAAIAGGTLQDMDLSFTADPARAGMPEYRFVLAFNPAAGVREQNLCEAGPARVQRNTAETRLITSFCSGDRLIASSIATGPHLAGSDDPVFANMVRAGVSETILGRASTSGPHR